MNASRIQIAAPHSLRPPRRRPVPEMEEGEAVTVGAYNQNRDGLARRETRVTSGNRPAEVDAVLTPSHARFGGGLLPIVCCVIETVALSASCPGDTCILG